MINYFAWISTLPVLSALCAKRLKPLLNKSLCYYLLMFYLLMHVHQFVDFIQYTHQDFCFVCLKFSDLLWTLLFHHSHRRMNMKQLVKHSFQITKPSKAQLWTYFRFSPRREMLSRFKGTKRLLTGHQNDAEHLAFYGVSIYSLIVLTFTPNYIIFDSPLWFESFYYPGILVMNLISGSGQMNRSTSLLFSSFFFLKATSPPIEREQAY